MAGEIDAIRLRYVEVGPRVLAASLGRSYAAVVDVAYRKLDLRVRWRAPSRPITEELRREIARLYGTGMPGRHIARRLDLNLGTLRRHMKALGLCPGPAEAMRRYHAAKADLPPPPPAPPRVRTPARSRDTTRS